MKELNKEYTLLFNGITDAISDLEALKARLEELQQAAERIVLEQNDDNNDEPVVFIPHSSLEVS